ncbi:MAG TPA: response regulator [Elusimicrobia bacterium]|nr:response regulator [Elusimicrobiota bacterium]
MKVLIVEDNALTRYTIKSLLNRLGHEVVGEAEDSVGAVKCFTELRPDVVFLDLILPGKSGVEILEELRKINPKPKIVIITAVDQEEIDLKLSNKGANAVMRKPFSFEEFKNLLKSIA